MGNDTVDTMMQMVDSPEDLKIVVASMRREIAVLKQQQEDDEQYMKWVRKLFNKGSAIINGSWVALFGLWQSGALDWISKIKIVE